MLKYKQNIFISHLIQDILHSSVRLCADIVCENRPDLEIQILKSRFDTTPLHFHATVNAVEREFCKNFMISYQNNFFYLLGKFWLRAHFIRESSQVCCEYRRL